MLSHSIMFVGHVNLVVVVDSSVVVVDVDVVVVVHETWFSSLSSTQSYVPSHMSACRSGRWTWKWPHLVDACAVVASVGGVGRAVGAVGLVVAAVEHAVAQTRLVDAHAVRAGELALARRVAAGLRGSLDTMSTTRTSSLMSPQSLCPSHSMALGRHCCVPP